MVAFQMSNIAKEIRNLEKSWGFKSELKWINVILITLMHVVGAVWCYYYAFPVKWQTLLFACFMYAASGFGVTGGAHRLWTHRSYKANLPLKILLLICFSASGQNTLQEWVRDHRVHHKFSDTNADPHNANRGLFFCHIGWLMMKKNAEVITKGKDIDMSDIYNDKLLRWHQRYFTPLKLTFCFILPTMIPVWSWGENWLCSVAWQCYIRYLSVFHSELTVNSLAHTFGYKPYNKNIRPAENRFVATCTLGEGWHNYHHAFPWDYRAAEHSDFFNVATKMIDFFHYIGWATDRRTASSEMIESMTKRIGESRTDEHDDVDLSCSSY